MRKKIVRIAFTGGGTGGHVYPALAVIEALRKKVRTAGLETEYHYFGGGDFLSQEIAGADIVSHAIVTGKLRRYVSVLTLLDVPKFCIGFVQAFAKMFMVMPDILFSKGGPGAFPVVLAAWWYRVPVVIHESDSSPGLTTLLSVPFARRIAVSFESASKFFHPKKVFLSGNPIRPSLLAGKTDPLHAKERLGFRSDKPLLLFIGGSQGAKQLNEFVELNIKDLLGLGQVLHQTGRANFEEAQHIGRAALLNIPAGEEAQTRYRVVPYLEGSELALALSAADIVIARAGSGDIFEIAAFGKASLLVPLPEAARDHQRVNAYEYAKTSGAVVIEKANLTGHIVSREIRRILENQETRAMMETGAVAFAKPEAADIVALEILAIVGV